MLKSGDKVPSFSLELDTGETITHNTFKNGRSIVYFYPKDDTPGCTKEACAFRDRFSVFKEKGVQIYGVSKDSIDSHLKFKSKYSLPFPLISDPDLSLAKAFGAWGEKNMYGKKSFGILRSTFVVGPSGTIEKVYPKVKPEEHADQILKDLAL
ncbi:MAG: thioredoxin-dependent thiol peroxidase [Bdellovibrionales bacterium]|nr:thioredoxin-dependent thiol peroxidase [Bdellovibrionales bacterium]